MSRLLVTSICLLLLIGSAFAEPIRDNSLNANPTLEGIKVFWYSSDESGVARFEIWRSSDGANFTKIAQKSPLGNGQYYEFLDQTAFKLTDSFYSYRVVVVYANGSTFTTPSVGAATHSVSSVRRTWGSIKAMFR
jgi:hypothetical protein